MSTPAPASTADPAAPATTAAPAVSAAPTAPVAAGGPTLHHLNNSQSQRILWLLEELGKPYQLKLYTRQTSGKEEGRSPPELFNVHPLGKSPVLVTADGVTISESTTIALYLIKTYDTEGKFSSGDPIRDDSLCSLSASSLGSLGLMKLFFDMGTERSPALVRPLVRLLANGMEKGFTGPETAKFLKYMENDFGTEDYFMGKEPGRADFVLSWPFDMMVQRKWVDLKPYPKLAAWRERILARPAWKAALEKGNGYNLSKF